MNTEHTNQSTAPEPFGYFKAEPFGWTDCAEGDEGAVALYEQSTVIALCQQLELERGSLFAENQRKQQLQGQVDALMAAMNVIALGELPDGKYANISTMAYAEEAYKAAQRAPIKDSFTAERLAEPVAWVRFCSDGCYEGPLMNSSPAMDGARRTSGAWTPLFAAQPVARDVLMALAEEVRNGLSAVICDSREQWRESAQFDLAAIVDRYAAQPPAVAVPDGWLPNGDGQIPSEMSAAGAKRLHELLGVSVGFYEVDEAFRAMLAAAQKGGA